VEKVKITVTINKKTDDIISILAQNNNVSKSVVIREALQLYINNMLSNPLENIEEKLNEIYKKLEKELNRYNSLLAKNTLYSIAGRQHLVALHSIIRNNKDEAAQIAEKSWNIAIDRLKNKEDIDD